MALDVSPDSLREAAAAMALLPQEVDKAAQPKSDAVATALKGSSVGGSLDGLDTAERLSQVTDLYRGNDPNNPVTAPPNYKTSK
jgi:hypothetical protein